MTDRALELLGLPADEPALLLDIGCGSGLSGEILDEEGHAWVGVDISPSMLEVALEREVEGDLFLQDIGQGIGFRPGSFDGAIRSATCCSIFLIMNAEAFYYSVSRCSNGCVMQKHLLLQCHLPSDSNVSSVLYTLPLPEVPVLSSNSIHNPMIKSNLS